MNRAVRFYLLLLEVAACQPPLSPDEARQLSANEQRWGSRGFANYSIESLSSCFCPPELNRWTRIDVIDGQVRRVTDLETGGVITDSRLSYWNTVEELFASIHNANHDDYLSDIRVTYDATLGFPAVVQWSPKKTVQDAGGTRSLRNAQPLP